jgi:hypothetical protein
MSANQLVFIHCTFIRGSFPSQRIFIIPLDGDAEFRGVAHAGYCRDKNRKPLGENPPPGETEEGFVLGIIVERLPHESARVQLPDANIYDLPDELIQYAAGERESRACT